MNKFNIIVILIDEIILGNTLFGSKMIICKYENDSTIQDIYIYSNKDYIYLISTTL